MLLSLNLIQKRKDYKHQNRVHNLMILCRWVNKSVSLISTDQNKVWVTACHQGACVNLNIWTSTYVCVCVLLTKCMPEQVFHTQHEGTSLNWVKKKCFFKNSLFAGLLRFHPLFPRLECQNCQKEISDRLFCHCLVAVLLSSWNSEEMRLSEAKCETTYSP